MYEDKVFVYMFNGILYCSLDLIFFYERQSPGLFEECPVDRFNQIDVVTVLHITVDLFGMNQRTFQ